MRMTKMELAPIGAVVVDESGFSLQLERRYQNGLRGLAGFSHLEVVWWAHRVAEPDRQILEIERPYARSPGPLGVFATRAPARPNPIALSIVQAIAVEPESGLVRLAWIDADGDTPILDVKPYHLSSRVRDATTPAWCAHWPRWYEDSATFDWDAELLSRGS
jgi:tRNA (Thr-GGU) A37 N-methylase